MTRLAIASLIGLLTIGCTNQSGPESTATPAISAATVRHVVLLKFKDSATPQQLRDIEQAFVNLPKQIPTIRSLEWGTNISPEGLAQAYTHCFFLTFATEKDRDAYLPHPAHKAFGQSLGPILDKVLVVDYKPR